MTPRGLVAFPITPMSPEGRVDTAALRGLLRRLLEAQVEAVGVLGSTGSYPYLARDERRRALDAAAAELDGRATLMAGVGALRTDEAIQHARDAKAAGARIGLLAPMSYTPLTEPEVFAHFEAVAGEGELPLCIYDNPASTHFAISDGLLQRLSAIAGVVALKAPAPAAPDAVARVDALRDMTAAGFSVGFSVDGNAPEALIAGGDAWYSVLAGLFPAPAMAISRAVAASDHDEARRLHRALEPMWALFRTHSSLRVIYAAANVLGLCRHAPPRPILPLPPAAQAEVAEVVSRLRRVLEGG